jgi:hypothetical protein
LDDLKKASHQALMALELQALNLVQQLCRCGYSTLPLSFIIQLD